MQALQQLIASTILVVLIVFNTNAQNASKPIRMPGNITYLLPDGRMLPAGKLDSLQQAWGEGRLLFSHSKEDDARGILRLVRMTDEQQAMLQQAHLQQQQAYAALLNKPAPGFELTDLQGKRWSLQDLRGKVVVLNFWFTTCPPCIKEMPALNELVQAYAGKAVVFLAPTYNDAQQVNTFLQKRSFDYTILPGSHDVDTAYRLISWPTNIVIDQEGIVKKIMGSGAAIGQELTAAINSLL